METQKLTCEKARTISIEKTLEKLGYLPVKKTEKEAWYLSPFRIEKKASFKVSLSLNRWYDHGEGIGGNIIDLIIKLRNFSVLEALDYLDNRTSNFSFHQPLKVSNHKKSYSITKVNKLKNLALLQYLDSRLINKKDAIKYCQEIYYEINNTNYFAIAFKNDSNGFELRNKYFKGCLGKKDITTIDNNSDCVCVFEGFINFLSYISLFDTTDLEEDYIILNSVSMVNKIYASISKYKKVITCLDNDNSGQKASQLIKENHNNVIDCSSIYRGYNDLNDYLISEKRSQRNCKV